MSEGMDMDSAEIPVHVHRRHTDNSNDGFDGSSWAPTMRYGLAVFLSMAVVGLLGWLTHAMVSQADKAHEATLKALDKSWDAHKNVSDRLGTLTDKITESSVATTKAAGAMEEAAKDIKARAPALESAAKALADVAEEWKKDKGK